MALVLACLSDPVAGCRLRAALEGRSRHRVVLATNWNVLLQMAHQAPADLVVVDPFAGAGGLEACATLHAVHPSVAILPYGGLDGRPARELFRLFELGVQRVVVRDRDDGPASFRQAIEEVLARRMADTVVAALGDLFPGSLRSLLEFLLLHAGASLDPDEVARSQFCHSKTLRARLRAAGLPSLNRMIVWTRLIYAAHLLAGSRRSVEQVVLGMGYPSAAAFRTQLQRYARMGTHELRAPGGLERLLECFRRTVEWRGSVRRAPELAAATGT